MKKTVIISTLAAFLLAGVTGLQAQEVKGEAAAKAKVEEATKEVKEKKVKKQQAVKTTPVAPKQPTPENAPLHHDTVPHSPRSLQI